MHDLLLQLLYDIIAILVPILVGYAIAWLQKRIGTEKMEAVVRELATNVSWHELPCCLSSRHTRIWAELRNTTKRQSGYLMRQTR